MQRTVSREVSEKAQRLVSEGKVTHHAGHRYWVEGDSGRWHVYVADASEVYGFCNCPAETATCSHLIAAAAFEVANPVDSPKFEDDPFEGLDA